MSKLGGFLENFGRSWQSRTSIWLALDSDRFSKEDRRFDEFQPAFKPPTFKNNGVFPNQFQPVPRLLWLCHQRQTLPWQGANDVSQGTERRGRKNAPTVVPHTSSPNCGSKRVDGTTRWLLFPNSWPHREVSFFHCANSGTFIEHFYEQWRVHFHFVSVLSALRCLKKLETNKFLVFFQGEGDFEIMFFGWM